MPVSDWAWSPGSDATSSGTITAYTSHWGGSQTKWNDAATWNLYTYNADQGISAVYEENTSEWIVTFVQSDGSGGYKETYDNTDWSFTPASDAVVVASIDTYATEWGGTNDKWNDNSDWNLYETSTPVSTLFMKLRHTVGCKVLCNLMVAVGTKKLRRFPMRVVQWNYSR